VISGLPDMILQWFCQLNARPARPHSLRRRVTLLAATQPVNKVPLDLRPKLFFSHSSLEDRLVLSCLIHAVADLVAGRTFPAGERGSAAGSLLSSHYPSYTCAWACVLCRPSPEFPFRFIWVLGWSTWHLALDSSSVLYLQHKLCPYLDDESIPPPPGRSAGQTEAVRAWPKRGAKPAAVSVRRGWLIFCPTQQELGRSPGPLALLGLGTGTRPVWGAPMHTRSQWMARLDNTR
jgi:hypothetical protein